jgi:diguanylate cyclase (GGDEF)-like protein
MRKGETTSILLIDLGNFKNINDTYGHVVGDKILLTFAQKILQDSIKRSGDTCGRYGGDEFIVILPNTGIKGAVKVQDRIQRTVKSIKAKNPYDQPLNMLISDIGVASWNPKSNETVDKFMGRADESMYHEKTARKEGIKVGS